MDKGRNMNRIDESDLQLHVSIIGWLHIVGSALFLVIGAFAFILLPTLGNISGNPDGAAILSLVGTAIGLLMWALGLPGFLAGYGLLKHKSWARFLALAVGVLDLANFPIGTAIGVYTLLILTQSSANRYFTPRRLA